MQIKRPHIITIGYALFRNLFICYNSTLCCILFVNTEIPEFDVKKYDMCHTILRNVVVSKSIVRWVMEFLTRRYKNSYYFCLVQVEIKICYQFSNRFYWKEKRTAWPLIFLMEWDGEISWRVNSRRHKSWILEDEKRSVQLGLKIRGIDQSSIIQVENC